MMTVRIAITRAKWVALAKAVGAVLAAYGASQVGHPSATVLAAGGGGLVLLFDALEALVQFSASDAQPQNNTPQAPVA